ncbi:MAG: hypothetical protein M1831_006411 [Alyxoria varia]|nr:MAG: hypothetical protein M1831_006411 [Alyxoria varia]
MRPSSVLFSTFTFLLPPVLLSTLALYLYPVVLRCDFPTPPPELARHQNQQLGQDESSISYAAPFRLLVFGDPQLEGDSSLPNPSDPIFPILWHLSLISRENAIRDNVEFLRDAARGLIMQDLPMLLWTYRKRLDLLGNDFYLAHIYRTLHWYLEPTHVAVLGDLIGSQWVNDDEFERRGWRFWNRVFKHGHKVEDEIALKGAGGRKGEVQALGGDEAWSRRIINVAGNHDVGYAGDLTEERLVRFEKVFGRTNWDVTFELSRKEAHGNSTSSTTSAASPASAEEDNTQEPPPNSENAQSPPSIRLAMLNSMNLDSPAYDTTIQSGTYTFINENLIAHASPLTPSSSASRHLTLLLTHIPLHKPLGVCADGPYFSHSETGIGEQNHLSRDASRPLLEGLFGMSGNPYAAPNNGLGRPGLVLTGHDHEGCDVYHHVPPDVTRDGDEWNAISWKKAKRLRGMEDVPGIREITVRSMMGEFGGNAGLLSAWFEPGAEDKEGGRWRVEYSACPAGVQHFWWAVHVTDILTVLVLLASGIARLVEKPPPPPEPKGRNRSKSRTATPGRRRTVSEWENKTPSKRKTASSTPANGELAAPDVKPSVEGAQTSVTASGRASSKRLEQVVKKETPRHRSASKRVKEGDDG